MISIYEKNKDATLTGIQALTAWSIARAFGHEWGQVEGVAVAARAAYLDGSRLSIEAIDAAVVAIREDGDNGGISYPSVVEDGKGWDVSHSSATGRYSWMVDPEGGVYFEICRVGGVAVSGRLESIEGGGYVATLAMHEGCCQRHVSAAHEMVSSVMPQGHAFVACAPMWAKATPDETAVFEVASGPRRPRVDQTASPGGAA